MKLLTNFVALCIGLISVSGANAALVASADGQTLYDTGLNVTWAANANLAATNTFGLATGVDLGPISGVNTAGGSYIYSNGTMTWGGALKWIGAMNSANYLGYNDWSLPTTTSYCIRGNCTSSQMGELYYNELGGVYGSPIFTTHNANLALFQNVQSDIYWSGTEYGAFNYAWYFSFNYGGGQGAAFEGFRFYTFAVRPGQVAAVPVPAAAWLLGSGLLGLVGVARRKTA